MNECPSTAYASEAAGDGGLEKGMPVVTQEGNVCRDAPMPRARLAADQDIAHGAAMPGIDPERFADLCAQFLQRIEEVLIVPVFAAAAPRIAEASQLRRPEVRPTPAHH